MTEAVEKTKFVNLCLQCGIILDQSNLCLNKDCANHKQKYKTKLYLFILSISIYLL